MHHPVEHPLVAHAHHDPEAERLAQAEALLADIERTSSALVHDMNNALTRILGRTQLLMRGHRREDLGQADLLAIDRASRELAGLSRRLMLDVVTPIRGK